MKVFNRVIILVLMSMSMIVAPLIFNPTVANAAPCSDSNKILGLPFWYEYLETEADERGNNCEVVGPTLPDSNSIDWQKAAGYIAIALVEILLRISGIVAVGFVVYGGFRYIVSQGEPEATKSARETILNAVIGLVIAIVATAAVSFFGNRIAGAGGV